MKHCSLLWLLVFLLLHLPGAARATVGPPATGRPLAEALNPDGTLRAGAAGSFDARAFRMGTAPDGRPVFRPMGTLGAGDERWADGFGMSNGVDGTINVVVQSGTGTYVGGNFTLAGGAVVNSVAKWNGTAWSSLGGGVNGSVYALAVASSGEVYVGGNLIQAGGIAVNRVAKWNGTAWSSLGTGVTGGSNNYGKVNALAVASSGEVYVGGDFSQAGGVAVSNVAKWNGTAWSSLGTGITGGSNNFGNIVALAVASSGEVYVGGFFQQAGGVAAYNVAKWNGLNWSSLGTGVNFYVFQLATGPTNQLYAGGNFTKTGDGGKAMARFAIYDPAAPLATAATRVTPAALFPNPAHGTATLRLPAGAARLPLTLSDALGRAVRQFPAPAGPEAVLDLRGLPAGVYLVRCGELTQRLVVE